MKTLAWMLCPLVVLGTLALAGQPGGGGAESFDKMKSLAGVWEGKDPDGNPVKVSYKVVSNGSAVMESIDHGTSKDMMITMYHCDGDKLMMTHYCSAMNQPRMRMTTSSPTSLSFEMFDVTNMSSPDDAHMTALVITWVAKNHLKEVWTLREKGNETTHVFDLKKKA